MSRLISVNPATESETEIEVTLIESISDLYYSAQNAFEDWSQKSVRERIACLQPALLALESRAETLARTISEEMGKPIRFARIEIQRTIDEFRFTQEHAESWLAEEEVTSGIVEFAPLGVVGVICPWNFPFLLALRSIVPALIAGNTVIFKPSELSLQCGKAVHDLFSLPPGVLHTIIGGKEHGAELVRQPLQVICFTGSTEVGRKIAIDAAARFIRVTLELGGLDAALVLKDADLDLAAQETVRLNALNSGQVCSAVKRIYVEEAVLIPFLEKVRAFSQRLKVGDPLDEATDLGPLVSRPQFERVRSFVSNAKNLGARTETGGERVGEKGFFFQHTVLSQLALESRLLHEEPFGPVLPVVPIKDWQDGLKQANNTPFGLMGSVWTKDQELARRITRRLDVGTACINNHLAGPPGTPWGGTKASGVGRMKTKEGLREFTNTKLIRFV